MAATFVYTNVAPDMVAASLSHLVSVVTGSIIAVAPFTIPGPTLSSFPGGTVDLPNNGVRCVWVDRDGILQFGPKYPVVASHTRIAVVTLSGGEVTVVLGEKVMIDGPTGPAGVMGATGPQGPQGATGVAGVMGTTGPSAIQPDLTLQLAALPTAPSAPPTGSVAVYGRLRHSRSYLDVQGPSGRDYPVQPFLGLNRVIMHIPESGTTVRTFGMPVTSVGTVSHPALASTNLSTSMKRWRLTSAGTSNSASESRAAQTSVWRGNAAGLGGFTFVARLNLATLTTNCRGFFGLLSATGATSTSQVPSALTNCLGFAWDATETTLRWQSNDGAGNATRVDLGSSFPTNSTSAVYSLFIHCSPNGSTVSWRIMREDTGAVAEGTVSADMPSNTTFLTYHLYMNNGGDAAAVAFDCAGVYIESDY